MFKQILLSLAFLSAYAAHADSDRWIPSGENQWFFKIDGVGGEADIHVTITPEKKVMFRVTRPCPDMKPKRLDILSWEAGNTWGTGLNCRKQKVHLSTPPLWELLVGTPQKAQAILAQK